MKNLNQLPVYVAKTKEIVKYYIILYTSGNNHYKPFTLNKVEVLDEHELAMTK